MRQKKREVKIGNVTIGGSNPIAVQTMLNVPVEDIEGNVAQAKRCEAAGCQILRVTCPSPADARCIEAVMNAVSIPIVADIHFDYKAALACADVGVDKIRINPGNIGDDSRVKAVVDACQRKNIPIRIGVNGGSLEKHILAKYGAPTPEAMVESALYHVRLLEKFDFDNIVISIKNSNVPRMMEAYRQLSAVTDYPLHVGVTEAGTYQMGLLKSGMGNGGMLLEGIGDTARRGLQDVRRSVRKLKPDALERMSLNNAIHQMIEDMSKVTNTKIYFVSYMEELEFEADEEEVIYRIIQESTTNAIRHGKATEIWIRISEKDEELMIIISDNGCGCESIKEGFGLKHIRERVELLNGEVNYQGMIGFTIIAKIPIRNKLTGKKDRDELNNLADNNDKAKDSQ